MTPAATHPDFQTEGDYIVSFAGTDVNIDRGTVTRGGKLISLTTAEYELLICFLMNANRELTRDAILQTVWGYLADPNTRTVDAHVMRLRHKLEPDPERPRHFITLHKVGYRFQP